MPTFFSLLFAPTLQTFCVSFSFVIIPVFLVGRGFENSEECFSSILFALPLADFSLFSCDTQQVGSWGEGGIWGHKNPDISLLCYFIEFGEYSAVKNGLIQLL